MNVESHQIISRSRQKLPKSCVWDIFSWQGHATFLHCPIPLPKPRETPHPSNGPTVAIFFSIVKWRSCLSIFWKPSLICPQLLKPHFDKLLHRYVRWLKTRWASSTGMMPGEGLKSVKNTPSDLPIYTDTNLSLFSMVGQMYFLLFLYPSLDKYVLFTNIVKAGQLLETDWRIGIYNIHVSLKIFMF